MQARIRKISCSSLMEAKPLLQTAADWDSGAEDLVRPAPRTGRHQGPVRGWLLPPNTLAKSLLKKATTATNATMTSFAPFLKSTASQAKRPSFAAPTAAPPTTNAASPYFATLSPERYSAYLSPVWKL